MAFKSRDTHCRGPIVPTDRRRVVVRPSAPWLPIDFVIEFNARLRLVAQFVLVISKNSIGRDPRRIRRIAVAVDVADDPEIQRPAALVPTPELVRASFR